ncbi:D-alanyl-D-alanine carboxypeptidase [Microbacterium sp. NPDC057944]|uniref:D-alanyl-D-alanine carboxypeptidase n=1 Tax=Microbacterium sp. NPDC057944 TaxID=3346286 RepID=UPI0036DB1573
MTAPDSAEATAPLGDAPIDAAADADTSAIDAELDRVPAIPDAAAHDSELEQLVADAEAPAAQWASEGGAATALTWVDAASVADHSPTATLDGDQVREPGAALWTGARLRPAAAGPGVLVPIGILAALAASYAGTTLLWPLHEVAPTVKTAEFQATAAPAAAITWPTQGSAAVGIQGIGTVASSPDPAVIASITKVVSVLMVLDQMPLAVGEQGPSFSFTKADSQSYLAYKRSDQSALDVPVGGSLTEFQMLQGILLGSANNYIDRLAKEIWGSDKAFADAAATWLRDRGIQGITILSPSGFDERNTATPEALIAVAERAMQNPVFAGIVGTPSVELPGAGLVKNTNGMLSDSGVVGIKTGTLHESWNLLTAKDVVVDGTTVHLYASVLTQADDDMRLASTRSLFSQVEDALQAEAPAVAKGTVVGEVDTLWGASTEIVTDADAEVVLWDAAAAEATPEFDLGEKSKAGAEVGTLTVAGPLDTATTPLTLKKKLEGPSAWWRLTHPLELFGLTSVKR